MCLSPELYRYNGSYVYVRTELQHFLNYAVEMERQCFTRYPVLFLTQSSAPGLLAVSENQ